MEEPTKAELYFQLHDELKGYIKMMSQAQKSVLDQEITRYPIFIIHQQEVALGIVLSEKDKVKGNWSVNLSTLEEFITKGLIKQDKLNEFKATYKSTDNYLCLFILSELGAEFIFLSKAG